MTTQPTTITPYDTTQIDYLKKYFPNDAAALDNILALYAINQSEAKTQMKEFLSRKITALDKHQQNRQYARLAAKLKDLRSQIVVPEAPWYKELVKDAAAISGQVVTGIAKFNVKKGIIKWTITAICEWNGIDASWADSVASKLVIAWGVLKRLPIRKYYDKIKEATKNKTPSDVMSSANSLFTSQGTKTPNRLENGQEQEEKHL